MFEAERLTVESDRDPQEVPETDDEDREHSLASEEEQPEDSNEEREKMCWNRSTALVECHSPTSHLKSKQNDHSDRQRPSHSTDIQWASLEDSILLPVG